MSRGSVSSLRSQEYALLTELLREKRIRSEMTQKAICDRLGKPKNYINKIESGERRLDVVEVYELCEAMNLGPLDVLAEFDKRLAAWRKEAITSR